MRGLPSASGTLSRISIRMIKGGIGNLASTAKRNLRSSSFSSSFRRLFSSTSSPLPLRSSTPKVVPSTAAKVADVDDDDDPASPVSTTSSVVKPVPDPTLLQPRVVVYDGVCHLCHQGVKWVIRADKHRKIKFCCVQSKSAEPYLMACGLEREDVLRRFLFVEGLGAFHQGSTAALRLLSYLPLPYSALSSFLVIPTPIRDAAYDYIAKRRYKWFGKAEDCLVLQEKELLERFIDREEMMGQT